MILFPNFFIKEMIPRLEVLAIVQKVYIKMAQRQKRPWTIWMPKNDVVLPFYSFFSYFCTELFCEVGIPAENFTFWFHVIQNELLYIYYCQKNENIRVEINRENIMKFWLPILTVSIGRFRIFFKLADVFQWLSQRVPEI